MSKDFIPGSIEEFVKFLTTFSGAINADPQAFGLTPADAATAQSALQVLTDAIATADKARDAAATAVADQGKAKDAAEAVARGLTKKINGHPTVDNARRIKAGLAPHDEARTVIGAPTTKPIARLEISGHYTLTLHFVDELTPLKLAKPHGTHGCQIWSHVGDPAPADATGYVFLALDTKTPYTDVHAAADAGKTAYYMVRWVNAKGEVGPWGDVVSAKIPV